jgi:hypothetical protein
MNGIIVFFTDESKRILVSNDRGKYDKVFLANFGLQEGKSGRPNSWHALFLRIFI